jgi:hypothetical protein
LLLLALSSCNLVAHRIPHEVSGSSAIKLAHNVPAVRLYSLGAYAKKLADGFACMPFGHKVHHLAFSRRERRPKAIGFATNCGGEIGFAARGRSNSIDQMSYRF